MVVFSDDMDRALASLVIANGAAATGSKVTLFFTFWGLNVIKKSTKPKVEKDLMGKMFGSMMAKDAGDLKLSKMNMMGMGSKMMKKRMLAKKVDSLEDMLQTASEMLAQSFQLKKNDHMEKKQKKNCAYGEFFCGHGPHQHGP